MEYLTGPDNLREHLESEVRAMKARRIVTGWQAALPPGRPCYLCSERHCDHIPRSETCES
jgi:hypothetical protein